MKKKLLITALSGAFLLAGCGESQKGHNLTNSPLVFAQPVQTVEHQSSKTYIGRVQAVEDTDITAQVTGYLKQRHYEEGQMVEKGQLLYSIEPSSFKAQVASANAAVVQAKATLHKSELDFERGKNLLPKGSISQSEFDNLTASLLSAQAQLEASESQLNLAKVNLSYTEIRAPFSGRISQSRVSTGDLVSPQSGVLTTLVSLDPVHASFSMSERERLELGVDKLQGNQGDSSQGVEVQLVLEDGSEFEYLGDLDFLGNRIDLNTGTIAMRANVPNPDYRLLPGQHIRVELRDSNAKQVVVVPRRSVQTDLEGNFVMVVVEDNIAERRNVKLGPQTDQGIIITDGLKPKEVVITQGLQRVRNGTSVQIDTSNNDEVM